MLRNYLRWGCHRERGARGKLGWFERLRERVGFEGWFSDFGNFELLFENYNTHTNKTNAMTCVHW
jgi:hypothetical protein